jgi:hypothetical protein
MDNQSALQFLHPFDRKLTTRTNKIIIGATHAPIVFLFIALYFEFF